jgi:hypothetical protein
MWKFFYIIIFYIIYINGKLKNNKEKFNGIPFRYLSMNVGNAGIFCWESKLCDKNVVKNIRNYISIFSPDLILLTEIYKESQLYSKDFGGPLLPTNYEGKCHKSINRYTGKQTTFNDKDSSHEHECIAWNKKRLKSIPNSEYSIFGRNDNYGKKYCNYDFTAFSMSFSIDSIYNITVMTVHPDSMNTDCRLFEISEYWKVFENNSLNFLIGGDFNTGRNCYFDRCIGIYYRYCKNIFF